MSENPIYVECFGGGQQQHEISTTSNILIYPTINNYCSWWSFDAFDTIYKSDADFALKQSFQQLKVYF